MSEGNSPRASGVTPAGDLARACACVEQVCSLLEAPSPEVLHHTAALLESVLARMAEPHPAGQAGDAPPGEMGQLLRIQRGTRRAGLLLEKAYAYYAGWSACLGAGTRGYRAGGEAAAWAPPRRFRLEG